jgi:prolipoprotein diacylglyceryltransferase
LAWVESIDPYWPLRHEPHLWLGAKTIVGGLLGGWIGVEIVKRCLKIRHSTGDAFVFPLIVGIAVGRIGCFLSGLADHTYGLPTALPWGVDFGDGVARHPTQLYEIAFLLILGAALGLYHRRPRRNGALFLLFMLGYLSWRLFIEFYKPRLLLLGPFSAIQTASMLGIAVCLGLLGRDGFSDSLSLATEDSCPTARISSTN